MLYIRARQPASGSRIAGHPGTVGTRVSYGTMPYRRRTATKYTMVDGPHSRDAGVERSARENSHSGAMPLLMHTGGSGRAERAREHLFVPCSAIGTVVACSMCDGSRYRAALVSGGMAPPCRYLHQRPGKTTGSGGGVTGEQWGARSNHRGHRFCRESPGGVRSWTRRRRGLRAASLA